MTWEEQAKKNIKDVVDKAYKQHNHGTVSVSVEHLEEILKLVDTYEERRVMIDVTRGNMKGNDRFSFGKRLGMNMAYCIMWGVCDD